MERTEYSRKVYRISAWIHALRNDDGTEWGRRGTVTTPHGIVEAFAMTWKNGRKEGYQVVNLDVVIDGREYTLREERPPSRALTDTGIAIVAHRWVREIVADLHPTAEPKGA